MGSKPYIAYLGTAGHIPAPERFDDETLLAALGANAGNLMFQYACPRLIEGQARHIGLANVPYTDRTALQNARALVFPAANHLRLGADWTGLCAYLEAAQLPLVVLGLGAQAGREDMGHMRRALRADPMIGRFAAILRERAIAISFRGIYSASVGHDLGLSGPVLGCPSWLINPDVNLGQSLLQQFKAVLDMPLTIGLAAAAPFEIAGDAKRRAIEQKLIQFLHQSDGLYIQQSGGIAAMRVARDGVDGLPENHRASLGAILWPEGQAALWPLLKRTGYFPVSAPEWITKLRATSLVLGSRLHGVMAALAAGRAAALIAHDSRTAETTATMALPSLEADALLNCATVQEVLRHIQFDADHFDQARHDAARGMVDLLRKAGLHPSAHLLDLADVTSTVRSCQNA